MISSVSIPRSVSKEVQEFTDGDQREPRTVRLNTEIRGEPASMLLSLKERGLVNSFTDAIVQGIVMLYEKAVQRDELKAKVELLQEQQRQ